MPGPGSYLDPALITTAIAPVCPAPVSSAVVATLTPLVSETLNDWLADAYCLAAPALRTPSRSVRSPLARILSTLHPLLAFSDDVVVGPIERATVVTRLLPG